MHATPISVAGVTLVTLSDVKTNGVLSLSPHSSAGDVIALGRCVLIHRINVHDRRYQMNMVCNSAFMYGAYLVYMKHKLVDENHADMTLFFGTFTLTCSFLHQWFYSLLL